MELKRKIDSWLLNWKNTPHHKPALIYGIRQSGKTHSVTLFARNHYENVIYMNFMNEPSLCSIFDGDLDVNKLIINISAVYRNSKFVPGETIFIFDEVQECPRARLSLKSFYLDARYDVIATGSYLGIQGYVVGDGTPIPVGYEEKFKMNTLDFEEFLWANGFKDEHINVLKEALKNKSPLPNSLLSTYDNIYKQYLCIGGFPEAVSIFLNTQNLGEASSKVKHILSDLKDDFGRRRGRDNKPLFKPEEVQRIRNAFSLIPYFLGKENKRYVVSKIGGPGNQVSKLDALGYLASAGIITKCYNLSTPSLPFESAIIDSQFKVYVNDIGLLIASLGSGTIESIMLDSLGLGKGMLYEELVADALIKNDIAPFYFSKNSGLEIDFVINYEGVATLLEVKAKNGNTKSAKTVLSNPDHYGQTRLIKIVEGNIGYKDGILTIPRFMSFLLVNDANKLQVKTYSPLDL
jgi:predicted AAA+ superfamily ATPase